MSVPIAVLRCGRRLTDGQRCTHDAVPGTDRCREHRRPPAERWRCRHTWPDGMRCEGRLGRYRGAPRGVHCAGHAVRCVDGCGRDTVLAGGRCLFCGKRRAAAERAAAAAPPLSHRARWQAGIGALPPCTEVAAETGLPCAGHAVPGADRCIRHLDLPGDAERCGHVFPGGRRCPRRKLPAGDGDRCGLPGHYRPTGQRRGAARVHPHGSFGPCDVCGKTVQARTDFGRLCNDHSPDCEWVKTGADSTRRSRSGERCRRNGTRRTGMGPLCETHRKTYEEQLVAAAASATPRVSARCGQPAGADGDPCGNWRETAGARCNKHRELPADANRCSHHYAGGDRCPARHRAAHGHGTALVCAVHARGRRCSSCAAPTARPDRLCQACAPRCSAPAAHRGGQRCTRPALAGQPLCAPHREFAVRAAADGKPRCAHDYGGGLRCGTALGTRAGRAARQLCPAHRLPCTAGGQPHLTAMADSLCRDHRPRCLLCRLPSVEGALCWRHAGLAAAGPCALVTAEGAPCPHPAAVELGADGSVCARHAATLPPDRARCDHRHPGGARCAWSRKLGRRYCFAHASSHTEPCDWLTADGRVCGKPSTPRTDTDLPTCEVHARVPADGDRCNHTLAGGGRAQRCPVSRWAGLTTCLLHTPRTRCAVVIPRGEPCGYVHLVRDGVPPGCRYHRQLPVDADRCRAEAAPGHRCPAERDERLDFCAVHAHRQPRCAARYRSGRRCLWPAPTGHLTCDDHAAWTEGTFVDDPSAEALELFVFGPRRDELAALAEQLAARRNDHEAVRGAPYRADRISTGSAREARLGVIAYDPYDVTGAQELYDELVARGRDVEVAQRNAQRVAAKFAQSTVQKFTSQLASYFAFCEDMSVKALPPDPVTVMEYLDHWSMGRIREGAPLQASTLSGFRHTLSRLCQARDMVDPFAASTLLADWMSGYAREFERMPVQAHAVRIDELARMVTALTEPDSLRLQDEVLITVLLDPEVRDRTTDALTGVNRKQATRMVWEGVSIAPAGGAEPTYLDIPRAAGGSDVLVVPNRAGEFLASGQEFPAGELPLAVRMCGTTALRSLYTRLRQESEHGTDPTGPVILSTQGRQAVTNQGVSDMVRRLAKAAGVPDRSATEPHTFDERLAMLEVLYAPTVETLRNVALTLVMWWASLRRVEAANLEIGDVQPAAHGKGMWVLVRKKKGDARGDLRPVPWHRRGDGSPLPTCAVTAWQAYIAAYERWLGRPVEASDPAFPSMRQPKEQRNNIDLPRKGMTDEGINKIVVKALAFAGIEAQPMERLSSHGLRAGFATENLMRGMPDQVVAQRQGRKSVESLQTYVRLADPFESFLTVDYDNNTLAAAFDVDAIVSESIAAQGRHRKHRRPR
ncbi:tyrosine-type recombinase/integrase [Trujillonella endophytica]|uniref:Phage integrase family protein n=1 Tax=Trujillonella endophytica TaxID=673521 RepID=A0A1H8WRA9_9ACTN|nr:tyrosine-type recombinase/integrase [Trujillella endophytica]SEP29628.1 Phage integrase family protein [Trujillella endophytica]